MTDHISRRNEIGSELLAFARFLSGLPAFVRRHMTLAEAQAIIEKRLHSREANFLNVLQRGVVGNPKSPYRALLSMAGCTFDDVRELVSKEGLDGTLQILRQQGVYVSFEEFKGLQPIVRGSVTIDTTPADFDNPEAGRYYSMQTGGSTGAGRRVQLDLAHLEALLPGRILVRQVHGVRDLPFAAWTDLPPGFGLNGVLLQAASDRDPLEWFSSQPMSGPNAPPLRYRLAVSATIGVARLAGAKVSLPTYVPFDQAVVLARWAAEQVQRSGGCAIQGSVSRLMRIAIAATTHNIDLTGVVLRGGGEPPTLAKIKKIVSTGAIFRSSYAFSEIGTVGSSCVNATGPNDQHFMQDHLAMIQASRRVPGFDIEVPAFCFTSLLTSAPKLLLNVESDDYGTVDTKPCGCEWERLGFPRHLRDIRSFRKLTGEGVTLVGSDIERILDELLPAKFGGSALDYQFAEEEDEHGFTRLTLRVAPSIELGDEAAALDFVLRSLEQSGGAAAVAQSLWRQAGTLRIRRESPVMTRRGKLMPLDIGVSVS